MRFRFKKREKSRTIETTFKDVPDEANTPMDVLRFFCIENKENIVACGWYKTKFCLESCKFYNQKIKNHNEAVDEVKYWNRKTWIR